MSENKIKFFASLKVRLRRTNQRSGTKRVCVTNNDECIHVYAGVGNLTSSETR